jgi:AraC-like DNA-binding protein
MTPPTGQLPFAFDWLQHVEEVRYPLAELHPVWVRHGRVTSGPPPPQPAVPAPQRHPYCEFNLVLQGRAQQFIQRDQVERPAGTVQLLGPGVAHYALILDYPHEFATIYFLPSLLLELGPERDGPRLLGRFTARQSIAQRLVRPPPALRRRLAAGFRQMVTDFERPQFGSELRLRTTLVEMLVELVRWEEGCGQRLGRPAAAADWKQLDRALRYLRENYSETVYAHDLAAAAGVNKAQLQTLFREALGMPWVQYLQSYRVHQAALLISQSPHTVTEAALAVGFSTLSHFNAAFRKFMGLSPSAYLQHSRRLQR